MIQWRMSSNTTMPALVTSGSLPAGAGTIDLERMRSAIRHAMDAIATIGSARDAVVMVRRASSMGKMMNDALKVCRLLEEEQFDLRQHAAEAHLRTQRRAGELLARLPKHQGGRPRDADRDAEHAPKPKTLQELGIQAHESHRWQTLAAIPQDLFEDHIRGCRDARRELTTASALALANRWIKEQHDIPFTGDRPSSKWALLREYDSSKRPMLTVIWLDPLALASAMERGRRQREIEDLARLRLWLSEFEQALANRQT